nr:unnamed protein product [Digitaria exilis]
MTTNGGRTGFFNSDVLKGGDFCGEELLTWALDPTSTSSLPSSTRTVKTISEVEAFSLRAEDLRFVATHIPTRAPLPDDDPAFLRPSKHRVPARTRRLTGVDPRPLAGGEALPTPTTSNPSFPAARRRSSGGMPCSGEPTAPTRLTTDPRAPPRPETPSASLKPARATPHARAHHAGHGGSTPGARGGELARAPKLGRRRSEPSCSRAAAMVEERHGVERVPTRRNVALNRTNPLTTSQTSTQHDYPL